MADEHFCTPALMPGTHCHNICDKPLQSTFSRALSKRFYSGRYRAQRIRDILFNGLYKFTLLTYLMLLLVGIVFMNDYELLIEQIDTLGRY